jgi:hypothetical protein
VAGLGDLVVRVLADDDLLGDLDSHPTMSAWLLAHDSLIQVAAAISLLLFAALAWWWSKDRPTLHDMGTMSRAWVLSKDRHKNTATKSPTD